MYMTIFFPLELKCSGKYFDKGSRVLYRHYNGNGCHRYDQSTIGVLISNYFNYNDSRYTHKPNTCMNIRRGKMKNIRCKFNWTDNDGCA